MVMSGRRVSQPGRKWRQIVVDKGRLRLCGWGADSAGQGKKQVGNRKSSQEKALESHAGTKDNLAKSDCGPGTDIVS